MRSVDDLTIDTIVDTRAGPIWYLRAADLRVLLPPEEQIAGEELVAGRHLKVMVLEGRRRSQDAVVVVSRSHPQLLRLLLEQEVPEVANGQVLVRGIVREAGRRSKVAVEAADPAVDARGACIGPRGVRHQAITSVLGQEQVQIVVWSADTATYIANALAPATVLRVDLDEESRTAVSMGEHGGPADAQRQYRKRRCRGPAAQPCSGAVSRDQQAGVVGLAADGRSAKHAGGAELHHRMGQGHPSRMAGGKGEGGVHDRHRPEHRPVQSSELRDGPGGEERGHINQEAHRGDEQRLTRQCAAQVTYEAREAGGNGGLHIVDDPGIAASANPPLEGRK